MLTVIIFLIVLAVLIFVHELGHFLFSKMFGIRVDAFKIGFGPKVFAWTPKDKNGIKSETEYGLNLIPFGGYVKIFGENPDEQDPNTSLASSPAYIESEHKRSMAYKPKWQQVLVLSGGVLFNIIFAFILYTGLFTHGVAATNDSFSDYTQYFSNQRIMVTDVVTGSPADKAGLKIGDIILNVVASSSAPLLLPNTVLPVQETVEMIQMNIASSSGSPISIETKRNGTIMNLSAVPILGLVDNKYAIGIAMSNVVDMKLPFFTAVYEGANYTVDTLKQTVVGLYDFITQIFHGKANFSEITGPVGIAGIVGDAARLGFTYLLMITALISINLAVINFIPFPALDGGRILFVIIEAIIRRRIPAAFTNWVNVIGFGLLMLLMVIITYKDIVRLFVK